MRDLSWYVRLSVVGILVACSGATAAEEPSAIVMVGSERLAPLVTRMAHVFQKQNPGVQIDVRSGGSTAGVKALASGAADFALMGRSASTDDVRNVKRRTGRLLIGVPIALDAVTVFVHPSNPVRSFSLEDVRNIVTYKTRAWKDLGATLRPIADHEHTPDCIHEYPKEAMITVHLPPEGNGILEILQRRVLGKLGLPRRLMRHELRNLGRVVAGDRLGFAIGGLSSTKHALIVPIRSADHDRPVLPTPQTIRDRSYPLAHYLYLYSAGSPTGIARQFVKFATGPEGQSIVQQSEFGLLSLTVDHDAG